MFTLTIQANALEGFLIGPKLKEKKGFDIFNLAHLPYLGVQNPILWLRMDNWHRIGQKTIKICCSLRLHTLYQTVFGSNFTFHSKMKFKNFQPVIWRLHKVSGT
jgi:hypothetical protein